MTYSPHALVALTLALAGGLIASSAPATAAETCRYFELSSILVNVRRDPSRPGGYLDVLEKGDVACVTDERKIGDTTWAFVHNKTGDTGEVSEVGGWANMRYLSPSDAPATQEAAATPQPSDATGEKLAEVTVGKAKPETPSKPRENAPEANSGGAPPASTQPSERKTTQTASAAPARPPSDQLRFDEPVPFGAFPVRGRTLEELAGGEPLFPPIEGLPEELWKKPCATCHKWNQERLCEQGSSYLKAAKYVLRHQHPYGGTYKLALMRWAKSGCK